jgi:drug/metabolite transporter (DMT)-like permease
MHGLTAHEIFTLRFLFAYICIWFISPRKLWADNWRDELWMLLLGVTGGSLYFVTENEAVKIDYVNNVSFIVCTAPLLTTLLALAFVRSVKATRPLILGSIAATLGVALVVFNGHFVLQLNPLGDLLAFCAALSWAFYSLLLKKLEHYSVVFITRKVFFYGLITVLPMFIVHPWNFPLSGFLDPVVWGNLLFLGFVASFACFALWSMVSQRIGALSASNYIYLNPISTVIFSALVLDEPMTLLAYVGSALILLGVYISNKH